MNASSSSFFLPAAKTSHHSQTNSFQVRRAQLKDLSQVADVLTHSFHSAEGVGILMYPFLKLGIYEDVRSRLCSDRAYYACLVATEIATEKVVGTVELSLSEPEGWIPKQYQSTYISNLAVSQAHRRQGVAQRLLRGCEQISLQWGYQDIYLHVLENNFGAQKLYEQAGYRLCRVEPSITSWLFNQPRRVLLGKSIAKKNAGLN